MDTALLTQWQSRLAQAKTQVDNFVVIDTTAGDATEFQKKLKTFQKEIESIRKGIEGPMKAAMVAAITPWKELETLCESCWSNIRGKLTVYQVDLERRRREERERINRENAEKIRQEAEALARAAEQTNSEKLLEQAVAAEQYADQVAAIPVVSTGNVTTQWGTKSSLIMTWDYEITDDDAVPRPLCSPDRGKIRDMVRELKKTGAKIEEVYLPGIRVFEKPGIQTR